MTFRFDPETAAQLRALAEETGRKQVTIVERAIAAAFRDYFGRRGADVVPPRRRDG
jgi:predicted transcriptional regulator